MAGPHCTGCADCLFYVKWLADWWFAASSPGSDEWGFANPCERDRIDARGRETWSPAGKVAQKRNRRSSGDSCFLSTVRDHTTDGSGRDSEIDTQSEVSRRLNSIALSTVIGPHTSGDMSSSIRSQTSDEPGSSSFNTKQPSSRIAPAQSDNSLAVRAPARKRLTWASTSSRANGTLGSRARSSLLRSFVSQKRSHAFSPRQSSSDERERVPCTAVPCLQGSPQATNVNGSPGQTPSNTLQDSRHSLPDLPVNKPRCARAPQLTLGGPSRP